MATGSRVGWWRGARQTGRAIVRHVWPNDPLATGLLLAGLALRLTVWWLTRGYQPFGDEQYYLAAGQTLAATGQYKDPPTPTWLPVQRVPLLSIVVAGVFRLAGPNLGLVNLLQIALSLATGWLAAGWARRLWGARAGYWALTLAMVAPPLITHAASFLYTETLYTFLAVVGLELAYQAQRDTHTSRYRLLLAGLAGAAIGATCLTRSSGLALLGLVLLWLGLRLRQAPRPTILTLATVLLAAGLTIAPWTLRNWQTYRGLLLLDTVGAYNLWRDNPLPGENPAAVIARGGNPVAQQRLATERGVQSLVTRPDLLLGKLPRNTLYLWHLELDSYARGGGYTEDLTSRGEHFWAVLAADAFLVGVALLAGWNVAAAPVLSAEHQRFRWLLLGWVAVNLASGVLLHSEARFRIVYLPHLIVLAAATLARVGWQPTLSPRAWARLGLAGLLAVWIIAGAWSPRLPGVLASQAFIQAADALTMLQPAAAEGFYEWATRPLPESERPWLALGRWRQRLGDRRGAIAAYEEALARQPHDAETMFVLFHDYRLRGRQQEARRLLASVGTSDEELLAIAWRARSGPPAAAVTMGSGGEYGSVQNVYGLVTAGERAYRYTNGNGVVRLVAPAGVTRLEITASARRPSGAPAGAVTVAVNSRVVGRFEPTDAWQTFTLDIRALALPTGAEALVELRGDAVPGLPTVGVKVARSVGLALASVRLVSE